MTDISWQVKGVVGTLTVMESSNHKETPEEHRQYLTQGAVFSHELTLEQLGGRHDKLMALLQPAVNERVESAQKNAGNCGASNGEARANAEQIVCGGEKRSYSQTIDHFEQLLRERLAQIDEIANDHN